MPINDKPEMDIPDQWDVACVLFSNKDLIAEASLRKNQNGLDTKGLVRINKLRNCNDVLTPDYLLQDRLRDVIKSVLKERSENEITIADCQIIASRYIEWLSLPLNSGWRSAAYDYRSSLFTLG